MEMVPDCQMKPDCVRCCPFIQRAYYCSNMFMLMEFTFYLADRRKLLYHCVPTVAITQGIALGHSVYDFISSYLPLKKVVSDVINSHEEMIIMACVALAASFISAFVIHFVASLASWVILVSISVLLICKLIQYSLFCIWGNILWNKFFFIRNLEVTSIWAQRSLR